MSPKGVLGCEGSNIDVLGFKKEERGKAFKIESLKEEAGPSWAGSTKER